ncbi:unnamed protein product [Urochloa humidicola]
MSTPPTVVLALRAEAPQANVIQPIVNDVVDVPTMGNLKDAKPRRSLRRRRRRVGDCFQPMEASFSLKLTEDEINEDIYSMTGVAARHYPRRRPVPLQQMLNARTPPLPCPLPPPSLPLPHSLPRLANLISILQLITLYF